MPSIAYHNGAYVPKDAACVSLQDRGHTYSDGIYEVIHLHDGRLIDAEAHYARLARSLKEIQIKNVPSMRVIQHWAQEIIRRNHAVNDGIYIQITRGSAPRNHLFPAPDVPANISVFLLGVQAPAREKVAQGMRVNSAEDIRWGRRDIKSISLLPNVLAKQAAKEAGCGEMWLIDKARNVITEGSSSNSYIITQEDVIKTHPKSSAILGGITRDTLLKLATEHLNIILDETPFTMEEVLHAKEAFSSSSTMGVMPVTHIDGNAIGNGAAGTHSMALYDAYRSYIDGI